MYKADGLETVGVYVAAPSQRPGGAAGLTFRVIMSNLRKESPTCFCNQYTSETNISKKQGWAPARIFATTRKCHKVNKLLFVDIIISDIVAVAKKMCRELATMCWEESKEQ